MQADRRKVAENMLRWLVDEANAHQIALQPSEWTTACPNVVQQANGHDCGVFTMLFAYCIGRGMPIPERGMSVDVMQLRMFFTYMLVTKFIDIPPPLKKA
jgi:Ulp1 family protease